MHGDDQLEGRYFWHGPLVWAISAVTGAMVGVGLALALPGNYPDPAATAPNVPLWLLAPFATLLLAIAVVPLVNARWWHRHFPDVAFFLGSLVVTYFLLGYSRPGYEHGMSYGQAKLLHSGIEYVSFIALIGGLYVVSGGILVAMHGRATPTVNTILLGLGAVLANIVGTTGASVLLIRPFMKANEGRLRPLHIVFFIFIVSNCGGSLTPIGDPPLYLGFLKGVPFFWVLEHLWYNWLFTIGLLLVMYFVYDLWIDKRVATATDPFAKEPGVTLRIHGHTGIFCLVLMVAGVFIDPWVYSHTSLPHLPYGAAFQIIVATVAHMLAPKDILSSNEFSFFPVKEVGLIFVGIFATMVPALAYLSANGAKFGVDSPTAYYFATGSLSAVLDNAPTYLNFLQLAMVPEEISKERVREWIATPEGILILDAISCGAVYFGAMTYIGNGPNFMVRSIAESFGVKMPSFFGYIGWSVALLLPVLVLQWVVFIR
ncbi:MAG: sodium:proton antiporter [Phycisphaerales bacterium]|jgi:Na+/H+ antiporter NhaD/arsenite permease-like protein